MARRKRVKIVVSGKGYTRGWKVTVGERPTYVTATKNEAINEARHEARGIVANGGLAQVIVKNRNGRISTEWTYPRSSDPRRHKG